MERNEIAGKAMSEPNIDLDKPNAMGTLDRLTTNVAISIIAVVPTLLICIAMPWRLTGLLKRDDPEGRSGMLLSPGAFFPLCLLVSMITGALLTTPELASNNGSFLGPNLALSIQSSVSEGDIWGTIGIIMPIYAFTVLVGSVGLLLKPLAPRDWSLRVSLRAAFYVAGAFVAWVMLATSAIDIMRASSLSTQFVSLLPVLLPIPTLWVVLWMYFWFFRHGGELSFARSALLSVAMLVLMLVTIVALGMLSSL